MSGEERLKREEGTGVGGTEGGRREGEDGRGGRRLGMETTFSTALSRYVFLSHLIRSADSSSNSLDEHLPLESLLAASEGG